GLRKCFLMGGNSTLRQHCQRHYTLYKTKCEQASVPVNHCAIPPKLAKALEKEKKERMQPKLDGSFITHSEAFT
ncbi:hypothetical protein EDB83DRAFT_2230006, partial [Lactarius deliciosus]